MSVLYNSVRIHEFPFSSE